MEYIISPIWILLDCLTLTIFSNSFFPIRYSIKTSIMIFIMMWCLTSICAFLLPDGYVYQFLSIALVFLLQCLIYRGSLFRYLLCATIGYVFIGIIDIAFTYGVCALLNTSYSILIWKKMLYTASVTTGKLVEVLLSYVFMKYHRQKKVGTIQHRWMMLTVIFPFSSLVMLLIIFTVFQDGEVCYGHNYTINKGTD